MICGKCNCIKKNTLTTISYQLNKALLFIHNIPASQCNCHTYVSAAAELEIKEFIEKNKNIPDNKHISFTDV